MPSLETDLWVTALLCHSVKRDKSRALLLIGFLHSAGEVDCFCCQSLADKQIAITLPHYVYCGSRKCTGNQGRRKGRAKRQYATNSKHSLPFVCSLAAALLLVLMECLLAGRKGLVPSTRISYTDSNLAVGGGLSTRLQSLLRPTIHSHRVIYSLPRPLLVTNFSPFFSLLLISPFRSGDLPFLGHRALDSQGVPGEYVWQTYKEAYERIQNFG